MRQRSSDSAHDEVYRESLSDWLDERDLCDERPTREELEAERDSVRRGGRGGAER